MKIEKGHPGYIKSQKTKYLIWSILEFGIVIAIFVLGYVQTKTRLNLFTVIAVVGCLPAAKMLVEFITMAPHKSIEPEKYQEIHEKANLLTQVYDMVITSSEKVMPVDAIVISDHIVCGYTSSPKTDETALAKHIAEYSEYGMDDIANELIMIAASIECTKLRIDYALTKED